MCSFSKITRILDHMLHQNPKHDKYNTSCECEKINVSRIRLPGYKADPGVRFDDMGLDLIGIG